ncbi:MAG: VWA domain-containing protein, partial [Planctomycetia bacterium]|nr:VWA domain-containing protein [Planctomycetia bacterium]
MTLLHPFWLLLLIPVAVSLLLWHLPSRLLQVLRVATLVLLLLAMCGLALKIPSRAGTVIVIADRSFSMPPAADIALKEAIVLTQASVGGDDRMGVISFGQTAAIERPPQGEKFAGFVSEVGRDASNLSKALEIAIALMPHDFPGRILV